MRFLLAAFAFLFAAPAFAQFREAPESKPQMQMSFAPIVKRAVPSVVNVYSARIIKNPMAAYLDDPMLRQLLSAQGLGGMKKERIESSLGSGVIISEDGLIITNHHVIANADEVKVALSDKREYEADIVLRDERTDLAVLKLKAPGQKFQALHFADSDAVQVGDLVLAIGNPFGVGQTVTSGIISAPARSRGGISDYQFFIQTDAAINPGNSGGPLIDMAGNLVGINTSIYSRSGGSIGIGFAIPANMVKVVADSAEAGGKTVRRPWLGAALQNIDSDIAETLGLKSPAGVLVAEVTPKGPSAEAGLQTGDVIVALGSYTVDDTSSLAFRIATQPIGSSVELGVLRKGQTLKLPLKLVNAPETKPRDALTLTTETPLNGASLANLSPALAEEQNVDFNTEGVIVTGVKDGSPSERLGLKRGDIIRNINGHKVESTAGAGSAVKEPSHVWRVTIERGGKLMSTMVAN